MPRLRLCLTDPADPPLPGADRSVGPIRRRLASLTVAALVTVSLALAACGGAGSSTSAQSASEVTTMTPAAQLGELIFNDTNLSEPAGMSCATCHQPDHAHATNLVVQPGVVAGRFGVRNSPSLRYLRFSPAFSFGADGPVGGFFRDGRAPTISAQAQMPFLNPDEMNNANAAMVMAKVAASAYADRFRQVWGADVFNDPVTGFARLALSLSAYQQEDSDFAPFTSRFDLWRAGKASLTADELRGLSLFVDPAKGNCAACHPATGPDASTPPLFTDFTYDALGVPRNAAIPANADPAFHDLGLCGPNRSDISDLTLCGAFKVPTLRNIAATAPYFHNGAIATLRDAVRFYNTRDTAPADWYRLADGTVDKFNDLPARYKTNVNVTEAPYNRQSGETPALTDAEVDAIVAFLNTLTDGYQP